MDCLQSRVEVRDGRLWKGKTMHLIQVLLALTVVSVLLGLVDSFVPMANSIKSIFNAAAVIVLFWLWNASGLFHSLSRMRVC
jgi:hypothetical protein